MKVLKENSSIKYLSATLLMMICLACSTAVYCQIKKDIENKPQKVDKQVAEKCIGYKKKWDAMKVWIKAHKKLSPDEIPVPPILHTDCNDCNDQVYEDKNKPIIDAFIKKSTQPESDFFHTIFEILRAKETTLGVDYSSGRNFGLVPEYYTDNSGSYPCLYQFDNYDIKKMLTFLEERMYNKVTMMVGKYRKQGEYFKAGAALYLGVVRIMMLLGYLTDDSRDLAEVASWSTFFYEKTKGGFFNQYQYQLYPGIFYLPRNMMLIGVDESYFSQKTPSIDNNKFNLENVDGVFKTFNDAISFMHFKLKINYVGDGFNQDGDKAKVRFNGEAELRCRIIRNDQGLCFKWEPVNGNSMVFKIEQVEFHGHDKEVITYDGPREFSVPVHFNVNMCDDQPVFRMFFDRLWPEEEHYKHNQVGELTTPMLYRLVSATLGNANTENLQKEVEKLKVKSGKYNEADMEAWNKRMEAHGDDPNYFKTEQGKKDLAIAQQLKKDFFSVSKTDQKKMQQLMDVKNSIEKKQESNPNYKSSAEYFEDQQKLKQASGQGLKVMQNATGGALSLNKLELPFKSGRKIPVNGSVGSNGGSWLLSIESGELDYTGSFKITLENTPDDRDNIKITK